MTTTHTTTPETPAEQTGRMLGCAASVLRDGRSTRTELSTLLDEELAVLLDECGLENGPAWMPWAEQNVDGLEASRPTVKRLLLRQQRLVPEGMAAALEEREAEGPESALVADPTTTGILVLRRSAASVTTGVRTFALEDGLRELRFYFYHQSTGVSLEEVVTAEGSHRFAVLPTSSVGERLREIVDPHEVASDDEELRELPGDTPPEEWGEEITAGTRHLTRVATTTQGAPIAREAQFHATGDAVHVVEAATEESVIRLAAVSPDTLREMLDHLVTGPDADGDDER